MGIELDLSELAVLRPIQTAAASSEGAAAQTRRGNDDGVVVPDAGDAGCVTPTATSSLLPRQLGCGADIDAAVCVTPTSSPCVLRAATVCPPAPRKPGRAPEPADSSNKRKRRCIRPGLQRSFFPVPRDLSTVFVPRISGATATARSPPRAAKKIRLHVVV